MTSAQIIPQVSSKRNFSIDYFKSLLVLGMVLSHTIQLIYNGTDESFIHDPLYGVAQFINLITFSGFFFCFGYANYLSYFTKDRHTVKKRILNNALRILVAYYLSAFAYVIFFAGFDFSVYQTIKILTFSVIPPYSEFLLSFFIIILLSFLFFNLLKKIATNNLLLGAVVVVSLISTKLVPYKLINNNQLGLIIGTTRFAAFPIVQYLCFFLAGVWFAQKNIKFDWIIFIIAIFLTIPIVVYCIINHHIPGRFPPSIYWIAGASFPLYLYYLFCIWIEKRYAQIPSLLSIGQHTLFYLLLSNIFLFSLKIRFNNNALTTDRRLLIYVIVMAVIYFLTKQVSNFKPDTKSNMIKTAPAEV